VDRGHELFLSTGVFVWCLRVADWLMCRSTGVYDHHERNESVANSCGRVGSQAVLMVVFAGTALASGGGTEGQRAG
jgi:hypothetical protein